MNFSHTEIPPWRIPGMTKRRVMTFLLHLFHLNEITGHQTVGLDVIDSQFVSGQQNRLKWEKKPVSILVS